MGKLTYIKNDKGEQVVSCTGFKYEIVCHTGIQTAGMNNEEYEFWFFDIIMDDGAVVQLETSWGLPPTPGAPYKSDNNTMKIMWQMLAENIEKEIEEKELYFFLKKGEKCLKP